ncbi:MAG: hypothetical protein JNJ77_05030 [Planctomycetia bacterium]|nr:hypothetical protein [Planctomycetia bacterium]
MSGPNESKMANRKRFLPWMAGFAAFWGLFAFFGVVSNPRFESIHTLDVIRLMTAGAGFAVTLMTLILFFNLVPRFDGRRVGEERGNVSKGDSNG